MLSVSNSDLRTYILDDLATLDPWLSLVLVMIHESGKGPASRWWLYWRILPHEFDTLVYWSPAELTELQGSAVVSKVGKDAANEAFTTSLLPLAVKHADLFGEYATDLKGPAAKDFFVPLAHRMASLVMAYAFDIEQDEKYQEADEDGFLLDDEENPPKGMVPLADMLNADADRNNVSVSKQQQYYQSLTVYLTRVSRHGYTMTTYLFPWLLDNESGKERRSLTTMALYPGLTYFEDMAT